VDGAWSEVVSNNLTDITALYGGRARVMSTSTDSALTFEDKWPRWQVTHTTLYDLIAAVNTEVSVEEDALVIACVLHLLTSQRLTRRVASAPRRLATAHRLTPRRRHAGATGSRRGFPANASRILASRSGVPASPRPLSGAGGRP